ncbi:TadE/TadG family type IV pilus assembly protein [Halofilum ochraceum]|uniref:TadE/TadG family type IV pilus assembly protein n=1 Tax=Halofilum ochraceum TaxID=1611323 RepID=UPI0008DB075A|nr:TadE/TadG family type IV pilus assembly protein [Halofilum ochraceum]
MNRKCRRWQKGTELVEFAFTSIFLFMLLFGIIEFSIVLYDKATITNASREGARTGILFRQGTRTIGGLTSEDDAIEAAVRDYADAYLISLGGPATLDVQIQRTDRNGDGAFNAGDELTVSAIYPYDFLLLPAFANSMIGGVRNIAATSVMRAE